MIQRSSRRLLQDVMNNREVERVPCGFWHHFILGRDQFIGLTEPEVLERAYAGHLAYYRRVETDLVKIMSEGFFGYPPIMENALTTASDLDRIRPVGRNHPWITRQAAHVRRIADQFRDEKMCFYNMFSPLQVIRIKFDFLDLTRGKFVTIAERYPEAFRSAGLRIMEDILTLTELLLTESGIDGLYFCVQNIQSDFYDDETYHEIVAPSELPVLKLANRLTPTNILHICGYDRHVNRFSTYRDYSAKIYNWAVHTEKIGLQAGKAAFGGACVLGGFDNNPETLIDTGTPEMLRAYTKRLIEENGYSGYIVGADCSIPNDINDDQVRVIRDACHEFTNPDFAVQGEERL